MKTGPLLYVPGARVIGDWWGVKPLLCISAPEGLGVSTAREGTAARGAWASAEEVFNSVQLNTR
jgi:hypothetical protein